ncbi:MAG: hypothetical protein IT373_17220 [Polyangiaceae bacterium]|nr:hypothetical protein [Polyangiaceae bacterium]
MTDMRQRWPKTTRDHYTYGTEAPAGRAASRGAGIARHASVRMLAVVLRVLALGFAVLAVVQCVVLLIAHERILAVVFGLVGAFVSVFVLVVQAAVLTMLSDIHDWVADERAKAAASAATQD